MQPDETVAVQFVQALMARGVTQEDINRVLETPDQLTKVVLSLRQPSASVTRATPVGKLFVGAPNSSNEVGARVRTILLAHGVYNVGQLISRTPIDLRCMRNMGEVALAHVEETLAEHGYQLREEPGL